MNEHLREYKNSKMILIQSPLAARLSSWYNSNAIYMVTESPWLFVTCHIENIIH